jgi:hypothetical protein
MTPAEVEAAIKEVQDHACALRHHMMSESWSFIEDLLTDKSNAEEHFLDQMSFIFDEEDLKKLSAWALEGNLVADEVLCDVTIRLLDWIEDLPNPLSVYIRAVLQARLSALKAIPKIGRPHPPESRHRDMLIFSWVDDLLYRFESLQATRNPAAKRGAASACSIVCDGLSRSGFALSEKRVNEIWLAGSRRARWRRRTG